MDKHATVEDFNLWADRAQKMSVSALLFTVHDCSQAAAAMRGWNPIREGFYLDQAAAYAMELIRRKRAGSGTGTKGRRQ
jgi:hypothetical protein